MPITRATNLAGLGTVFDALTDGGGLSISGVSTFTDLNITRANVTGVSTLSSAIVGSAVTITAGGIVAGLGTVNSINATHINATGVSTLSSAIVGSAVTITAGGIVAGLGTVNSINATHINISGVTTVAAGSTAAPSITPTGDTDTGIFFPAADTIAFGEGGSEAVRIDSSGRVGIGITNPGAKLDVSGDIRLSAADAEIEFNTGGSRLKGRTNALSIHTGGGLDSESNEQVRINSTGVGIGTTNPGAKLHIYSAGSRAFFDAAGNYFTIDLTNNSTRVAFFGYNVSTNEWQLGNVSSGTEQTVLLYDRTNSFLSLGTVGSERLRITSSGNVGIGITNPLVATHIVIPTNGTALKLNNTLSGTGAYVDLDFDTYATSLAGYANAPATIRVIDDGSYSGHISFRTKGASIGASQSERLRIDSSGNVGIGTTSPQAPFGGRALQLGNISDARSVLTLQSSTTGRNSIYFSDGTTGADTYRGYIDYIHSDNTMTFGVETSEALRITSSGNVGIGTTNPGAKLDVNGNARANRFTVPYGTVLTTYKTNNPSTNVAIEGSPSDRDFWIFRDPADTGTNWGIYHRQIDSSLSESGEYTVPGNSISFVGGGTNSPGVTIDLANGDLQVKRNIKIGNDNIIQWVEVTPGVTEWSFTGGVTSQTITLNPSTIPSTARYVLADVFATANISDHQNFVLGRNTLTNQKNWVDARGNQPSTNFGTLTRQAVTLTYNGETDNYSPFFGVWYSSQHIPTSGRTIYFNNYGNSSSNGWLYVIVKAYSL